MTPEEKKKTAAQESIEDMQREIKALKRAISNTEDRIRSAAAGLYPEVIYECSGGYNNHPITIKKLYLVEGSSNLQYARYDRCTGSKYGDRIGLEEALARTTPQDARDVRLAMAIESLEGRKASIKKEKQNAKKAKARIAALQAVQFPEDARE